MPTVEEIEQFIAPFLTARGYELVEAQYRREQGQWVLRVFVDKMPARPEGSGASASRPKGSAVSLADCETISDSLGRALDSSPFLGDSYVLEVSSPGINRALKTEEHFKRYVGEKVRIALHSPLSPESAQRNFSGILVSCGEGTIQVHDAVSGLVAIPLSAVAKAHLDLI